MKSRLEPWCCSLTCVALLSTSLPAAAASPRFGVVGLGMLAPEDDTAAAREAYNEGEKAYRLGKFDAAATAFERAYELSGLPDILYNIGLSHLRWYDVDPDVAHLRKAKVVFQNYVIEIQKNPELGDLEEAEAVIAQIDEKLQEAEAKAGAGSNTTTDGNDTGSGAVPEPVDLGPDPGKKLRLGGAIAMGIGGVFVVTGAVSGVILGVKGQGFEESLANSYAERTQLGCDMPTNTSSECDRVNAEIDAYQNNGKLANALAVGLGLTFGGLGVIGIVSGAVLFMQGNKQTKTWQERQVSVVPNIGRDYTGLTLSGRF